MYRWTESERLNVQRYFIDQNADPSQRFFITSKEDVHHIVNVMRNDIGNEIIVTFNDQQVYRCEITKIDSDQIEIKLTEDMTIDSELPQHITVCSGLIKADKYEWLIQKATELGASHFIATQMTRSVVKLTQNKVAKKLERWQKIIKEAAEQSYRLKIPEVTYKESLKAVYEDIDQFDHVLLAYEDAAKDGETHQFRSLVAQFQPEDRVLIIFGPEGGLTEDEVALFENEGTTIGLGPRILRAETAPLYALSAISYEQELSH
nr:16S rRNA (uracil(1498)-N(3))-methyltransferase [Staphylococcus auricularis]